MNIHNQFKYDEIKGYIFGVTPNYESEFKLEKYIERILKFSAVFALMYFKKNSKNENDASKFFKKIINRGYLTNDSIISILSYIQKNNKLLEEIGLENLKILDTDNTVENINIYELKQIINDLDGAYISLDNCQIALNKLVSQLTFITELNIKIDEKSVFFLYKGEEYFAEDLLIFEKRFFKIKTLKEIVPEILDYERI
ncbi:MAG: hypothetical protein E7183_06600 [Erysipelotrichaceae bacterium]|nr:hypothetical protein [Erysipelotrichaceae bacterium]